MQRTIHEWTTGRRSYSQLCRSQIKNDPWRGKVAALLGNSFLNVKVLDKPVDSQHQHREPAWGMAHPWATPQGQLCSND